MLLGLTFGSHSCAAIARMLLCGRPQLSRAAAVGPVNRWAGIVDPLDLFVANLAGPNPVARTNRDG